MKTKNKFDIYRLLDKDFRYKPDMTEIKGKPFHYDITLDLEGFPLKFNGIRGEQDNFLSSMHEEEVAFSYAKNMIDYATTLLKELDKHGYKLEGYLVKKDENDPVYSDKLPPRPRETPISYKPMWTYKDEIDKFQEILDELDKEITKDTEENIRVIIDEHWDEYGARVLEGYKGLRGLLFETDFNNPSSIEKLRYYARSGQDYAEKNKD